MSEAQVSTRIEERTWDQIHWVWYDMMRCDSIQRSPVEAIPCRRRRRPGEFPLQRRCLPPPRIQYNRHLPSYPHVNITYVRDSSTTAQHCKPVTTTIFSLVLALPHRKVHKLSFEYSPCANGAILGLFWDHLARLHPFLSLFVSCRVLASLANDLAGGNFLRALT